MPDRIKGSNLPFINLSKENLRLIYDALEAEQAGKMIFALTEYIYDGIEPNFETKIEKSVWNNILMLIDRKAESYFKKATANRENGKKGGRPKKNNDFQKSDFKAYISPDNNTDNTNYHNSIESVPNATKTSITEEDKTNGSMYIGTIKELEDKTKARESCQSNTKDAAKVEIEAQNADLNDNFDNYSERLYNLIDDNIAKIRQSTDILAQKQIEIGSQMDNTVAFHRNVLYDLRKRLGWDTKDGLDFQQFIDEEINRKTAQIRYERAI